MTDDAEKTATEPPAPDGGWSPDADWAKRLHDFTHEVELIISGAVLFGLLQIPGRLDLWFDTVSLRFDATAWTVSFFGWYYVKLIVYTLILSFGLHLASRAYWVGLVGLDSAFPRGVSWENINYGPNAKRVYRERLRPLPELARRTDRFCSSIFSFAFWTVLIFAISVVAAGLIGGASLLVARLAPGAEARWVFWGALAVFAGAPTAAALLDRALGDRIDPEGLGARAIRKTLAISFRGFGAALFMPIQFTLFSNIRKTIIWPLYVGVFVVLVVAFLGGELVRAGTLQYGAAEQLPVRPGVRSVDGRYFADTRDPVSSSPFIQTDVVTGPYVRLEIPLVARRDAERIVGFCAEAGALGGTGLVRSRTRDAPPDPQEMGRVLDCLGGLWHVRLDGEPLELAWDFRSLPSAGVTGLVAYLPTAGLEPGAHVLEIEEVPFVDEGAPEPATDDEPTVRRHFIRFRV